MNYEAVFIEMCPHSVILNTGTGQSQSSQGKSHTQGMSTVFQSCLSSYESSTLSKPWHLFKVFRGSAYPNRFPQRASAGKPHFPLCLSSLSKDRLVTFSLTLHDHLCSVDERCFKKPLTPLDLGNPVLLSLS